MADNQATPIHTVLLTDDADNRVKAMESGIKASSVSEYIRSFKNDTALQDKIAFKTYDIDSSKAPLFPPHLTPSEVHSGIKNGKILQGSFYASRENYLEGTVNVEGYEKSVNMTIDS